MDCLGGRKKGMHGGPYASFRGRGVTPSCIGHGGPGWSTACGSMVRTQVLSAGTCSAPSNAPVRVQNLVLAGMLGSEDQGRSH
jgi:hypothetical protein